ncbi:PH domain-containing protein [Rhodococcus fascians]|nr:PH domain-containing protein [Rhodococcus fascians]MBY3827650.1 PH domain-containing protein [Rhodococcus fascians]MBY3838362.1 PH domain-containing protein [Rhodococcus fascians]MBY3867634.1 PH domain-containing protein [Rhodococcus fascians]MBY3886666.1 PH domain-containing protein [Rhodococcus fascians]
MWINPVDNFPNHPQGVYEHRWATPAIAVGALVAGGIALAIGAVLASSDAAGTFLVGLAAVGTWVMAALAAAQRPRLAITPDGSLVMKRLTGTRTYSRADIVQIKVVRYPRLGRRVPMLELDVRSPDEDDDRLIIFGRWDLGADPRDVFEVLDTYGLVPPNN